METNPTSTALEVLQSAYRVAPESKIFAPLGDAYRRAGRLDEAVQVLEQGTSRHPDYVSALVLLALCQMDLGRDADAEANLARVLALDPENLVALKNRARRASGRGDWTQVEPLVELVLGIDPYDREALQLRDEARARRAVSPSGPHAAVPIPPQPAISGPIASAAAGAVPAAPAPFAAPALPAIDTPRPGAAMPPSPEVPAGAATPQMAASDAEWDVQRDADRIVIRPRAGPEATPPRMPGDEFSTLTLARIYESQGYVDKALAIYEELQRQQPGNADVLSRLQALRQRAAAAAPAATPPPGVASPGAEAPRWRLLDAETLAASPEEAAEQLRQLTDTVRDRERGRRHTEIGQAPPATSAPDAVTPATTDEPDFERFLRYVRSLKHTR